MSVKNNQFKRNVGIFLACCVMLVFALGSVLAEVETEVEELEYEYEIEADEWNWDIPENDIILSERSEFNRLISFMERTIEDPLEFNMLLYNFEFIREAYALSDDYMDFIADLIMEGRDMEYVLRITYFWLETNEDISVIREMYDLREVFYGSSFWMDFAFDEVTSDRHGALTDEDVYDYLARGLDFEDLYVARVLSRQGVMTVHEILDEITVGTSFVELAVEIDSSPSRRRRGRSGASVQRSRSGVRRVQVQDSTNILSARRLADITGENLEVFLEVASIEDIYETVIEQISQNVMNNLSEQGVLRRPRYGLPGQKVVVAHFRAEIMNNGISEETLNMLFDEGFEYEDILNASIIALGTNIDVREILEQVQTGENWFQITENLAIAGGVE